MATRPDITAFATHEERVRAFMASIPSRRRRRVEAKYEVLSDWQIQELRHEERLWSPHQLDDLEVERVGLAYRSISMPSPEEA